MHPARRAVREPQTQGPASGLGRKPESLSRAFWKLKPVGVQVSRHDARIEDVEALRDYAKKDPADAWSKAH